MKVILDKIAPGFLLVVFVTMILITPLQQFWYIALVLAGIWLIADVIQDRADRKLRLDVKRASDRLYESLIDSIEETKLLRSGEIPTDDDILLYYKMYLKKKELEDRSEWTTHEPMSFEKWEETVRSASTTPEGRNLGYQYMIGRTSDAFIGSPLDGNMSYQRFTNYKQLVEEEEREKANGTKEE